MASPATGSGTAEDPWVLKTPPGTSEYQMNRDDAERMRDLATQALEIAREFGLAGLEARADSMLGGA